MNDAVIFKEQTSNMGNISRKILPKTDRRTEYFIFILAQDRRWTEWHILPYWQKELRKVYNWMTDIAEDQHQLDIRTTDAWQGNADIKQGDDLSDDKINVSEPYLIPQTSRVGLTKPLPSSARGTWCRSLDPSKVSLFVCLSVHQSVLPSIPRR